MNPGARSTVTSIRLDSPVFRTTSVALSLTACGTDYHYVSNRDSGAYFKVPDHWEVYGTDELLQSEDRWLTDDEVDDRTASVWLGCAASAEYFRSSSSPVKVTSTLRGPAQIVGGSPTIAPNSIHWAS